MTFTCWYSELGWNTAAVYSWPIHPLRPPGLEDILGLLLRVPTDEKSIGTLKFRYSLFDGDSLAGSDQRYGAIDLQAFLASDLLPRMLPTKKNPPGLRRALSS